MNRRQMTFFKVVLGFMAFIMVVGYPLMVLSGFPGFQQLLSGNSTDPTAELITTSRKTLKKYPYDIKNPTKYPKKNLSKRVDALQSLGAAYMAKSAPDAETGEAPSDADRSMSFAIDAFEEWYQLKPKSEDAMKTLADAYDRKTVYDLSKPLWLKLTKLNPTEEVFFYRLGNAAQNQKNPDKLTAEAAFKTYLKLAPDGPNADTVSEMLKNLKDPNGGGSAVNFG